MSKKSWMFAMSEELEIVSVKTFHLGKICNLCNEAIKFLGYLFLIQQQNKRKLKSSKLFPY